MLNPYEMAALLQKLNSGDPIEPDRAIYTLVRHILKLEQELEELNREVEKLRRTTSTGM